MGLEGSCYCVVIGSVAVQLDTARPRPRTWLRSRPLCAYCDFLGVPGILLKESSFLSNKRHLCDDFGMISAAGSIDAQSQVTFPTHVLGYKMEETITSL